MRETQPHRQQTPAASAIGRFGRAVLLTLLVLAANAPLHAHAQLATPAQVDEATALYNGYRLEYHVPGAPQNVAVEAAGKLWFTSPNASGIGLVEVLSDLEAGPVRYRVTFYATGNGSFPYDLVYTNGVLWFTLRDAAQLGRFDTTTREMALYDLPSPTDRPTGIDVGDGRVWMGTAGGLLLAFDPATATFTPYPTQPGFTAHPRIEDVVFQDIRSIWFSLPDANAVGEFNAVGERFFLSPTPAFRPAKMAFDGRRLWVAAKGDIAKAKEEEEKQAAGDPTADPNRYYGKLLRLVGETRGDWAIYNTPTPNSGPFGVAVVAGPRGPEVWFTDSNTGTLSRLRFDNFLQLLGRETSQLAPTGVQPFDIAAGPDLHLWVADAGRGVVYEVTPPYIFKVYLPSVQ